MSEELNMPNSQAPANVSNPEIATDEVMQGGELTEQGISDIISKFITTSAPPLAPTEILPPSYYEPDRSRNVIGGQTSMGMPLMSAGIPMFSAAVLQQAENDLRQAEMTAYKQKMQDASDLMETTTPLIINDKFKDLNFQEYQNNFWNDYISKGIEQYGSKFFSLKKNDIQREAIRMQSLKQTLDGTYEKAKQIEANKNSENYVSPHVKKVADDYLRKTMSDEFSKMSTRELQTLAAKTAMEFQKAESIEKAGKGIVDKLKGLVTTGDWTEDERYGYQQMFVQVKSKGIAALEANPELKKYFDRDVDYFYDLNYGNVEERFRPTKEEFVTDILARSVNAVEEATRTLGQQQRQTSGGDDKPKYTYTPTFEVRIGTDKNPLTYKVNDVTTFNTDISHGTKGNTKVLQLSSLEIKDIADIATIVDRVFNYGGYSFASATVSGSEVVMPLTTDVLSSIKAKIPSFNSDGYKVYSKRSDIDNALIYMSKVPKQKVPTSGATPTNKLTFPIWKIENPNGTFAEHQNYLKQ